MLSTGALYDDLGAGWFDERVTDRDRVALGAPTGGDPVVLRGGVRALRPGRGVGCLDERRPEPDIARAGCPALALAGALVGTRTHPGLRGEVSRGREAGTDAGDRVGEREGGGERAHPLLDLGREADDLGLEEVDVPEPGGEEAALVGTDQPLQRGDEAVVLVAEPALAMAARTSGSSRPSTSASSMARPEAPRMLQATAPSLTLAPSSVLWSRSASRAGSSIRRRR